MRSNEIAEVRGLLNKVQVGVDSVVVKEGPAAKKRTLSAWIDGGRTAEVDAVDVGPPQNPSLVAATIRFLLVLASRADSPDPSGHKALESIFSKV